MESLAFLLVVSIVCLCDASYNNEGFLTSDSEESIDYDEEVKPSCGTIMSSTDAEFKTSFRISGGIDAKYLEFPWMTALFMPNKIKRRRKQKPCELADNQCWFLRCGGSLISSEVVLTAARCIYPYRQYKWKARAGDWNLDTFEETLPYQERYVAKAIYHPFYHDAPSKKAKFLQYDAALLVVESPYILAGNIGFICLPPPNIHMASVGCKVAGWGRETLRGSGHQSLLQVVKHNYVDHDQCQKTLRARWSSGYKLHSSFTCAGGVPGESKCKGDGGMPLMCLAQDHYYARGIASWSINCGKEGHPGMYTDIVKVRNWIDQAMRANGYDTNTYTHVSYKK